jgi:hypothetical protein
MRPYAIYKSASVEFAGRAVDARQLRRLTAPASRRGEGRERDT